MEKTYTLADLAMMTGFTDRTLRNYLKQGLLKGEKNGGTWQFPAENVDAFFAQPYVKEGLRIKRSATVFDFMAERKKKTARICVILDLPCTMAQGMVFSDFFCRQMEQAEDTEFNYHWDEGMCRIMVCGEETQVSAIMENWRRYRS